MSVRKEANRQTDPQIFTYSHVAFAQRKEKKERNKQIKREEGVKGLGPPKPAPVSPRHTLVVHRLHSFPSPAPAMGHFEHVESFFCLFFWLALAGGSVAAVLNLLVTVW